jgi:hypothetical protein
VRRRCPTSARRHLSRHWSKQHTSSIFIVNGLGRSEAPKEHETGWSGSSRDTWRRTAPLNWKAK